MHIDIGKFMIERANEEAEAVAEKIAENWEEGFPHFLAHFKKIYKGEGDPEEHARTMWEQITVEEKWQEDPGRFKDWIQNAFVGIALHDNPVFEAVEPLIGVRFE